MQHPGKKIIVTAIIVIVMSAANIIFAFSPESQPVVRAGEIEIDYSLLSGSTLVLTIGVAIGFLARKLYSNRLRKYFTR